MKHPIEKALLKEKLHRLIDEVDDEIMLENLLEALHGYQKGPKRDSLDDLSPAQLADFQEAMEQVKRGEVIPHEVVKAEFKARTKLVQFLRETSVVMPPNW